MAAVEPPEPNDQGTAKVPRSGGGPSISGTGVTLDKFKAACDAINNAELASNDRCNTIEQSMQANVPHSPLMPA